MAGSLSRRVSRQLRAAARAAFARDPEQRYTGRFELVHAVTRALGFQLYNRNLSWREDPDFAAVWSQSPFPDDYVADRQFILYSMARSVAELPGDTAECGVLAGASSYLICSAMERTTKHHHMFDSFEGLSAPASVDHASDPRAYKWERGDLSVPLTVTQQNLARFERTHFYPGWIPTRFAEVTDRKFCFVHVDVDLYQPTHDALAFFYERLVPGGILLCDDYGFSSCPGARRAFDELAATWPERHVVHLTSGQGFVVKR